MYVCVFVCAYGMCECVYLCARNVRWYVCCACVCVFCVVFMHVSTCACTQVCVTVYVYVMCVCVSCVMSARGLVTVANGGTASGVACVVWFCMCVCVHALSAKGVVRVNSGGTAPAPVGACVVWHLFVSTHVSACACACVCRRGGISSRASVLDAAKVVWCLKQVRLCLLMGIRCTYTKT